MCEEEDFCQAVECGLDYCAWWKNDECNAPSNVDKSGRKTCIKLSLLKGKLKGKKHVVFKIFK